MVDSAGWDGCAARVVNANEGHGWRGRRQGLEQFIEGLRPPGPDNGRSRPHEMDMEGMGS